MMNAGNINRETKLEVLEWVASLQDVRLIDFLNDFRIMQSEPEIDRAIQDQMIQRAQRSEDDIKNGRTIPLEKLRKEFFDDESV